MFREEHGIKSYAELKEKADGISEKCDALLESCLLYTSYVVSGRKGIYD